MHFYLESKGVAKYMAKEYCHFINSDSSNSLSLQSPDLTSQREAWLSTQTMQMHLVHSCLLSLRYSYIKYIDYKLTEYTIIVYFNADIFSLNPISFLLKI